MTTPTQAIRGKAIRVCYTAEPEISVHERQARVPVAWLRAADSLAEATPRMASGATDGTAGPANSD